MLLMFQQSIVYSTCLPYYYKKGSKICKLLFGRLHIRSKFLIYGDEGGSNKEKKGEKTIVMIEYIRVV